MNLKIKYKPIALAIEKSSWGSLTRWLANDFKKQGMRAEEIQNDHIILGWAFLGLARKY
jgi:type II secretory pathway component PulM